MSDVKIIAEAGVNHNGCEKTALALVDAAVDCGADLVKFQTFKASALVTKQAPLAQYQKQATQSKTQYAMLKSMELSFDAFRKIKDYCEKKGVAFLSTPFDEGSLYFLVDDLGLDTIKLSSGDITNAPLLYAAAKTGCDIIISTGNTYLSDIEAALSVLALGFSPQPVQRPSRTDFLTAYRAPLVQARLKEKVTLLHCTSEYPAPFEDINLAAMKTLSQAFNCPVGYSDHSQGVTIPIAAAALGALVIEKHFTLDKTMEGPDHKASLAPDELALMVRSVRTVSSALGSGLKYPSPSEIKNSPIVQKSLVARHAINKGALLTEENIAVLRSGGGISPYDYWSYLNKTASKNYQAGDCLDE